METMYEQMLTRKQTGEVFDLDLVTFETLRQLWWDETVVDKSLAALFDVDVRQIEKKRHLWGLKQNSMIRYQIIEFVQGQISQIKHEKNAIRMQKIMNIVKEIQELSELERSYFEQQLARE